MENTASHELTAILTDSIYDCQIHMCIHHNYQEIAGCVAGQNV